MWVRCEERIRKTMLKSASSLDRWSVYCLRRLQRWKQKNWVFPHFETFQRVLILGEGEIYGSWRQTRLHSQGKENLMVPLEDSRGCGTVLCIFIDLSSTRARLRALGLLLADGALTVGRGKAFWRESRKIVPKVGNERSLRGLQTGRQTWNLSRPSQPAVV